MSSNSTLPATGDVIAADDVGGVKHQQVKLEFGTTGIATPVSLTNPLPTAGSSDVEYAGKPNGLITASGNTTVYTPASGKSARIHWLSIINRPVDSTCPLITVSAGATLLYTVYGVQRAQVDTGPVNGAVVINLSAAGNVAYNFRIEDV